MSGSAYLNVLSGRSQSSMSSAYTRPMTISPNLSIKNSNNENNEYTDFVTEMKTSQQDLLFFAEYLYIVLIFSITFF